MEILVDVADYYDEFEEMVRFSTYFNGRTRWLQLFECIGSAPSLAFTPQRHGLGIEVSSPPKDGLRLEFSHWPKILGPYIFTCICGLTGNDLGRYVPKSVMECSSLPRKSEAVSPDPEVVEEQTR